ncbi:MAG: hypothetical protein L6W00_23720 [Lentisphaeria bacterium]|nr:MAG: hypothetical protein L6W00_23720 [Lentisphaeria bacterium]
MLVDHIAEGAAVVSAGHGQQVAHRHAQKAWIGIPWQLFRKEFRYAVVELKFPLLPGESDRRRSETLAEREEFVRYIGAIGCVPQFRRHFAVTEKHEAVNTVELRERVDKAADDGRGNSDGFRCRA